MTTIHSTDRVDTASLGLWMKQTYIQANALANGDQSFLAHTSNIAFPPIAVPKGSTSPEIGSRLGFVPTVVSLKL